MHWGVRMGKKYRMDNEGFSGTQKIILLSLIALLFVFFSFSATYLGYVKAREEGWLGFSNDEKFIKPDNATKIKNDNIKSATGFKEIQLDAGPTRLNARGEFNSAYTNNHDGRITIESAMLIDKKTSQSCRLISSKGNNIPPKGYFYLAGVECPKGYPGDIYNMWLDIEYYVQEDGEKILKDQRGSLRGYYV